MMDASSMDMTEVCSSVESQEYTTKGDLQKIQYEDIIQENYNLKKKVELMEKFTSDLENEMSCLTTEISQAQSNLSTKQNEISSANMKITQLELLLEEERLHARRFMGESSQSKTKESGNNEEFKADQEQLSILTEQIQNLQSKLEEEQLSLKHLADENASCAQTIHQLKCENKALHDEVGELREHLSQKTKDLQNLKSTLESAREEKILINTELEILKAADSNASRGNSLFAEVEENRQKIANQRELLKIKYVNLKKVLSQKQVEINKLKLEVVKIRREDKDDVVNVHQEYSDLVKTLKTRVSELEEQIKLRDCSEKPPVAISGTDNPQLHWVNTVLELSRKEVRTLQEELERRSSNYVIQGHQLFEAQKHNRKLKAATLKLQSEIDELKLKLDIVKSGNENVNEDISPPPIDQILQYQKPKCVTFKEELDKSNAFLSENKENNKEN